MTNQHSTFWPILEWMDVDFHPVELGNRFPEVCRVLVVLQIEVVVVERILFINGTDCGCRFQWRFFLVGTHVARNGVDECFWKPFLTSHIYDLFLFICVVKHTS